MQATRVGAYAYFKRDGRPQIMASELMGIFKSTKPGGVWTEEWAKTAGRKVEVADDDYGAKKRTQDTCKLSHAFPLCRQR
jgi:hypothetical protein